MDKIISPREATQKNRPASGFDSYKSPTLKKTDFYVYKKLTP